MKFKPSQDEIIAAQKFAAVCEICARDGYKITASKASAYVFALSQRIAARGRGESK